MAGRNVLQFRPRGDKDGMPYSPQRDLATLYMPAMREAIHGLDQVNWRPFFRDWMDACKLTEEDLAEGIKRFIEAHRLFTGDATITQPVDAFEKTGFLALSPAVQAAIYYRIGEVVAAGFFIAIRDVTFQNELPPNEGEIARTVAAARQMAERLTRQRKRRTESRDELEELVAAQEIEIQDRKAKMIQLQDMVHARDQHLVNASGKLHAAISEHEAELWRLRRRSLWQTLRDWWTWRAGPRTTKATGLTS